MIGFHSKDREYFISILKNESISKILSLSSVHITYCLNVCLRRYSYGIVIVLLFHSAVWALLQNLFHCIWAWFPVLSFVRCMTFVMVRFEIYWFEYFCKNILCVIYVYPRMKTCHYFVQVMLVEEFTFWLCCSSLVLIISPLRYDNFKECWASFSLWTWIELILKLDSDSTIWYQFIRSDIFFSLQKIIMLKNMVEIQWN